MKRMILASAALLIICVIGSAQAQEAVFDVKGGIARAKDPGKIGFNSELQMGVGINQYLSIVAAPGFTWFSWDEGTGIIKQEGPIQSELKANIDAYCFPLLAMAKVRLPDVKQSLGIEPYFSVGAGYMWMKYKYSSPAYTDEFAVSHSSESIKSTYKGFAWQAVAGIGYQFPNTNMSLILEGGYRGAKLKKDSYEVDMSGFVLSAGLSFAIGGSSSDF